MPCAHTATRRRTRCRLLRPWWSTLATRRPALDRGRGARGDHAGDQPADGQPAAGLRLAAGFLTPPSTPSETNRIETRNVSQATAIRTPPSSPAARAPPERILARPLRRWSRPPPTQP